MDKGIEMTDRELLGLAAKAAGYNIAGEADSMIVQHNYGCDAFIIRNDKGGGSLWNPLTDDGDALRLAVKLQLSPEYDCDEIYVSAGPDFTATENNADPYAATRRAIVRAAAEIGSK